MSKTTIYLASGWFTPNTREILEKLETCIESCDSVSLYSPRRDGIMLPPNQKHDTELRENIFKENISNITSSDLVVANIDSLDPYNDPGTIYEIGYAMANNVPVIGFANTSLNIRERFKGILNGFDQIFYKYDDLKEYLEGYCNPRPKSTTDKILFVGSGDLEVETKLATYISDSGFNLRWLKDDHVRIYTDIEDIFKDIKFMIAVVDDRRTLVSWMIGQAYSRGIPVITYSDYNYGINVMLLVSVLTHIRGTEELVRFLQQVKREGLESIPKFDISQLESM